MKVLMFNGSPKANGCTYTALCEMAKVLQEEGIETEIMHVGGTGRLYGLWRMWHYRRMRVWRSGS